MNGGSSPPGQFSAIFTETENGDVAKTLRIFPRARDKGWVEVTKKQMKDDLMEQLRLQKKCINFYEDLVDDYIYYWELKKKLIADIKKKGIRYPTRNGNGLLVEKPNESVVNLQKVTITMLKILNDLNLKEPMIDSNDTDGYI